MTVHKGRDFPAVPNRGPWQRTPSAILTASQTSLPVSLFDLLSCWEVFLAPTAKWTFPVACRALALSSLNIFLSPYRETAGLTYCFLMKCLFPHWTVKPMFPCLAIVPSGDGPEISESIHSPCHSSGHLPCFWCVPGDQGAVL